MGTKACPSAEKLMEKETMKIEEVALMLASDMHYCVVYSWDCVQIDVEIRKSEGRQH